MRTMGLTRDRPQIDRYLEFGKVGLATLLDVIEVQKDRQQPVGVPRHGPASGA